jgi:predicted PolB exonuclease-like 3'-5' exonuclease
MTGGADCLVFDIETVPDAELGRRLGLEGDDHAVAGQMLAARLEATGSSFLPLEQHRVVAISTVLRSDDQLQVWSLGAVDSTEDDLVRRFFSGLEKLRPTLVSWNGSGFDLPVLHYRMLRHGIASSWTSCQPTRRAGA